MSKLFEMTDVNQDKLEFHSEFKKTGITKKNLLS